VAAILGRTHPRHDRVRGRIWTIFAGRIANGWLA
jgi:hypothetical protein